MQLSGPGIALIVSVVVSVEGMAAIAAGGKKAPRSSQASCKRGNVGGTKGGEQEVLELLFSSEIYKVSQVCLI